MRHKILRICAMLEPAGVYVSENEIADLVTSLGLEAALETLNARYQTRLQLGEYLIRSEEAQGFWSNDFGWCPQKLAATGYTAKALQEQYLPALATAMDAEFVKYEEAADFNAEACPA